MQKNISRQSRAARLLLPNKQLLALIQKWADRNIINLHDSINITASTASPITAQ